MSVRVLLGLVVFLVSGACAPRRDSPELLAWKERALRVTIARDDWGIPHIHGRSDADAVFGLLYAQAEDDFSRIEANYLKALGRTAEADGVSRIYEDLRIHLGIDLDALPSRYATCPEWLKQLATASADGLNFFLAMHPAVHPKVLTRFEPWMALAFSEGSIGWDIESVSLPDLEAFYGTPRHAGTSPGSDGHRMPGGSNGMAVAPSRTASGSSLLLINPHTAFYFRAEAQVQSDEGLNAYGAVTWGQFFAYQGFNERVGWMHTSTAADAIDEYAETIVHTPNGPLYRSGDQLRPVGGTAVPIAYRTESGRASRTFTVYRTHHGPIVREEHGKWVALKVMQEPERALMESFLRTKAVGYDAFRRTLDLHGNSSNNTVYADADGTIAFFNPSFVPRRNTRLDWTRPVDGSDPSTEWLGVHAVDDQPNVRNPAIGWIQNTNNGPYSTAGPDSPTATSFPTYMDQYGENPRGLHAAEVLSRRTDFSIESLIAAAFDPYLTTFDELLPPLFAAYGALPGADPFKNRLSAEIAALTRWDRRWSVDSQATALAVYWAQELDRVMRADPDYDWLSYIRHVANASTPEQRLRALAAASDRLTRDFGTWRTAWGEINRFQRLTDDITPTFRDSVSSLPVGFTSGRWGSLAAFEAKAYPGTKRMYGTSGNSFVAVVEFGRRVRAKAITVGGQSGDPASRHFSDQAQRYATGALRDVYFYREDLDRHLVVEYHPGASR